MKDNMEAFVTLAFLILIVAVVMFVFCIAAMAAGAMWGWASGYHAGTERSMCVHVPYMDGDDDDDDDYGGPPMGDPYDPMRVRAGEQN